MSRRLHSDTSQWGGPETCVLKLLHVQWGQKTDYLHKGGEVLFNETPRWKPIYLKEHFMGFPGGTSGKEKDLPASAGEARDKARRRKPMEGEARVRPLGREEPLDWEMATHSRILAWKILLTEEPGGLQSMGSQSRTRLSMRTHTRAHTHTRTHTHTHDL